MGNTRVTRRPNLTGHRFFARAIIGGFLAVCSTMLLMPEAASAQGSSRTGIEIDHSSTGFPLSGGHAQVVCERCHLQGIFRGTPTQCMQCHSPGGRVVSTFKPTNHIPTTVNCSSCHRTTNWTPAFFTHNGVAPGTCSRCHNQTIASGKPATHIPTTMACDSCHRTVGWTGAAFKHTGVGPGTCATCHNGIQAPGKSAGHVATTASCDSCHRVGAANWLLTSTGYNHAGVVPGTCATCHNGSTARGKSASHVPTTQACDTCHKSTTTFVGAAFNHTGIVSGCATCHNGSTARGKSASHVPTTQPCETCHKSTTTFVGAAFNHTGIVSGCATCHNGSTALGKSASHVPTTQPCETCHRSTTTFTGAQFNHTGITTGCATCHNGSTALGKPANHIPVATACETCHKSTTAFSGSRYHSSVVATPGQCNTCHERGTNWLGVQGKRPSDHTGREAAPNSCDNSGCHRVSGSF